MGREVGFDFAFGCLFALAGFLYGLGFARLEGGSPPTSRAPFLFIITGIELVAGNRDFSRRRKGPPPESKNVASMPAPPIIGAMEDPVVQEVAQRVPVQIQRLIELPLNCQHLKQCGAHIKNVFTLFVIPKMRQIRVVHHLTQSRLWDGFELGVRDQTAAANPFVRMSASINLLLALEVGVEVLDYGMAVVECCPDFDEG
ncbi:hypothetical protein DFH09DRAFT_1075876 [Mycena vulgaris]|nr:hypothetical protein DFH09DRAFT_1075876 [Mycena vulgaris]